MVSKLIDGFLVEYLKRKPFATYDELVEILSPIERMIRNNKDKSQEELIDMIIESNVKEFNEIRKKYGVLGYTANIKVANYNIKLYGGNINYLGEEMPNNALFDIASMTKFYTQVIAYNLIHEGVFRRSDKITSLDKRFKNLGDLTVDDILTFGTTFKTDGIVKDKKTINEALESILYANVIEKGKWNYNDIGLIIIKEVMEHLTGLDYPTLVDKYITYPLHLTDTHILVPKMKYKLITGTPNFKEGKINDMTANALGGYSGHAGIFATSDDIIRFLMGVRHKKIVPNIVDAYTPGKLNDAVGIMGNTYVSNRKGLEKSFVDRFEPLDTFAISGSTRVNAASSKDSAYTVMFNPSSMSIDDAKMRMDKINRERISNGLKPITMVKEFEFSRDGKLIKYNLIDPRYLLPVDPMANVVSNVAKTTLRLRFLDYVIKQYDKSLEEINIEKKTK